MKALDKFRMKMLTQMSEVQSFQKSWAAFKPKIDTLCNPATPTAQEIFELGNHLSDIFKSNIVTGRGQSAVSTGGTAWECLVVWYLNLIFWGTDVIAARRNKNFIPKILLDSLSVSIANHSTNSESDIIIFSVPNIGNISDLTLSNINELISSNVLGSDLAVVQCKTNWADNSQIPMLWDLIYNAQGSNRIQSVQVGKQGIGPTSFRTFSYAFVTVPTQKKPFKPNAIAVLRVKNLTGGNYWGRATEANIASSISEFPGRNFSSVFSGGVQTHINAQLQADAQYFHRFSSITFSD